MLKKRAFPPTVLKLVWEDNPSKMRLCQQKRAPTTACPLCGSLDDPSHFLACEVINESQGWMEQKINHQTKAGAIRVPGFLAKSTLLTMEGGTVNGAVHVG